MSDNSRRTRPRQRAHCAGRWKVGLGSRRRPRPRPARDASVRPVPACSAATGGRTQTTGIFPVNSLGPVQLLSRPGRRDCRLQPFSYCPPVSLSAPSPPARAPRDGRIHQSVGARRSRGRRRGRRGGSVCRRLGHGQLHPRPVRLPGGPEAGRHGSGSGGAALPGRGPEPPAAPAAALGPSGGDPAGNAHTSPSAVPCPARPWGFHNTFHSRELGRTNGHSSPSAF